MGKRVGEEGEWAVISKKGEVRTTEYVASGLMPDVDYYFRVSAMNCAGLGDPIEMEEPVQAKDILGIYILFTTLYCFNAFFKDLYLICHFCYLFIYLQRKLTLTKMLQ